MHRLDRIDDDQVRRFGERREDVAHRCRGGEADGCVAEPEALCAETDLIRGFLTRNISDRFAREREFSGGLKEQRRFADAGIAADERCRPRNEPAAQRTVKFGNAAGHPVGQSGFAVERHKRYGTPAVLQIMPGGKGRYDAARILDQRIPLKTVIALPRPFRGNRATDLADIAFLGARHLIRTQSRDVKRVIRRVIAVASECLDWRNFVNVAHTGFDVEIAELTGCY